MNKEILIGFAVVLALLLVAPVVINLVRGGGQTAAPADTQEGPAFKKEPPLLNESNLTGSAWEVRHPELPCAVTIYLNQGGQAVATVPALFRPIAKKMLGTEQLAGTWSVSGDKLTASVQVQDKTQTVQCDISGDKLYFQNKEIPRVQ
jgi:hypothetical protein